MTKKAVLVSAILLLAVSPLLQAFTFRFPAWRTNSEKEEFLVRKIKSDFLALTGTEIDLKGLRIIPSKARPPKALEVRIRSVKIKNPKGFQIPNLAFAKRVRFFFDPAELEKGNWRITNLFADFTKVN